MEKLRGMLRTCGVSEPTSGKGVTKSDSTQELYF